MEPRPAQLDMAKQCLAVLREHRLVYLAAQERTGKTLTSLLVGENYNRLLVITKKKALDGWNETLDAYKPSCSITLTNYHNVWKIRERFDLVILDEAHNYISSFPKIGKTAAQIRQQKGENKNIYDAVRRVCRQTLIMYMSATPHAQGHQMLYHQFSVSSASPWRMYDNFYQWFRRYGKPYTIKIQGVPINQYDKCHNDDIADSCKHLFVTKTRAEVGIVHEPVDKVHYVTLSEATAELYNELMTHSIVEITPEHELVGDTTSKLRTSLHALEGGTYIIDGVGYEFDEYEKIRYIMSMFGDTDNLVIMYHFKQELIKLKQFFTEALLLQATSYSEGVDLHKYDNLVIYSQDYSSARHTQRRCRQCNHNRTAPITIHHILVKDGTSEQVYKIVCVNKTNFVDSVFKRVKL